MPQAYLDPRVHCSVHRPRGQKKTAQTLLSCFLLVEHIDLSWNHIEPSLTLMYQKLVGLGFVYYNGEIQIVELETEGSGYHV